MKRSPMPNRKKPLGESKKRKPLAKRSKKARDIYEREGGRRDFVERILRERPLCEACPVIGAVRGFPVTHASADVHEIKTRAMGGDVLDEKNVLAVCRWSHGWIHSHPAKARRLGLLGSRYNRT